MLIQEVAEKLGVIRNDPGLGAERVDIKTGDSLESPYVFVDAKGERFKDVKRSFKSACRKAGIKDFRFNEKDNIIKWCARPDSNGRPADSKSDALSD